MILFVLIAFWIIPATALINNPADGPCVVNDDGLKCSKTGYYETVQCDENSCYCVTPHNAIVAYDTRTTSSRIAPKCGTCYAYLQKLFANGDLPDHTFIPKCDVSKGNFEPAQCEPRKNKCYCVNTSNGQEIQGTRTTFNNTKSIRCMKIDFPIDETNFPEFVKPNATLIAESLPVARSWCAKNRDPGSSCKNQSTIRYWFDKQTFLCLPFLYNGCGGNENSYDTKDDCYGDCALADYSACALQTPPARNSDNSYILCSPFGSPPPPPGQTTTTTPGPVLQKDGCPKAYVCLMGAFFGTCCDQALTDKYNAAFKPVCKNKKPPLVEKNEDYKSAIIGKACSDNFCPKNYTCEYNGFFAFCCPK